MKRYLSNCMIIFLYDEIFYASVSLRVGHCQSPKRTTILGPYHRITFQAFSSVFHNQNIIIDCLKLAISDISSAQTANQTLDLHLFLGGPFQGFEGLFQRKTKKLRE